MLTATVIGSVWATRRLAELPNAAFPEVLAAVAGRHHPAGAHHLPGSDHPAGAHHLAGQEP